jgi:hypothetical protein
MRWDAAGEPIQGGNEQTKGWNVAKYRKWIAGIKGLEGVPVVGTDKEAEMVEVLRGALGLD